VEDLVLGLYVSELDRPWLESPFLFQGFSIGGDDELRQLRDCCEYVIVDLERSDADAVAALRRGSVDRRPPRMPAAEDAGAEARRRELEVIFGSEAYPNPGRFRRLLREADGIRRQARRVVDELMAEVRAGHSVDSSQAREVVRYLVRTITRNTTASLWLNNLKARDEYTAIHCMNVCVLSLAFGRYLNMATEELEMLGLGALLHDIGKMRTPGEVLNKPGPLTEEEFAVMRRHPMEGYEAMVKAGDVPQAALDIIRGHHERVSGRGYPAGMVGESIPLSVRVVAIADVYDAMTSDRVYRDAMSADEAIKVLFRSAADDFGRDLVEAFIRCIGIYPMGSLVELNTGALGVVISSQPEARLRPVLVMVRNPDGEVYEKRLLLNLAALDEDPEAAAITVRRVVNPADYDIDVVGITLKELAGSS